jgi:HSP20 family protein
MFTNELVRFGRAWDPWRELGQLQEEVNRLFSGVRESNAVEFPPVNLWMSEEGVLVAAELPGLSAKNLEISVLGDTVTLAGKRELEASNDPAESTHRREREHGSFSRSFTLPFRVETDKVTAQFKKGVLELFLPRAESDRARRITIKAS